MIDEAEIEKYLDDCLARLPDARAKAAAYTGTVEKVYAQGMNDGIEEALRQVRTRFVGSPG